MIEMFEGIRSLKYSARVQLAECSRFVLMEVETLGVARSLGWKVHMRCANGYRQETRYMRKCSIVSSSRELPNQNVILTGEESMWLPRLFVWC